MTGYVVFAHGSSVETANEAVRAVTAKLSERGGYEAVETAFLEGGRPDLRGAVEILSARGVDTVVVIPYFLTLGLHLQRDLPRLIREIEKSHPGLRVGVTPPLDGHPAMIDALLDRAQASCRQDS
ncbi:MAG: CbiX/SirB N-terminal domain-containing protein [Bryobacteraceae bacterium]|jgi:sirohydrochlorin ferrochelatase